MSKFAEEYPSIQNLIKNKKTIDEDKKVKAQQELADMNLTKILK